ncbi:hypothetical protein DPMN_163938 [Dreissena polymorpha]|uniref:Uncharacterized protein n=1 Tax=Dreissena polymorpha TaxID=45954 RepID=A0A9D4EU97_DREPO|nr:hypothetical protein DPMN_163938 [Dreissena polymorpha]
MAEATIIFDGQVLNLERGGPQHATDVHDAVPLVMPTVPDFVRGPGMVNGKIAEGDHGDPVCVDAFRVQRVAVNCGSSEPRGGRSCPGRGNLPGSASGGQTGHWR